MRLFLAAACIILISASTASPQRNYYDNEGQVTQSVPNYTKLTAEQIRHLQNRGFGPTVASAFKPTKRVQYEEDDDEEYDSSTASTQVRRPTYAEDNNYPVSNAIPIVQVRPQQRAQPTTQEFVRRPGPPQQFRQHLLEEVNESKEEEEKEEPDRLTVLLPQSRFDCTGKQTGYYADEGLGCEVFHYCQDNARHSWICPEGFTFHQVHLICMPPGGDNICDKSSQFHFVNEYLYKPLNLEEHQSRPNISLKYSDRYYPDSYYDREYDDEDIPHRHQPQQKQSIRVTLQQAPPPQQPAVAAARRPQQFLPTFRPETTVAQVFRSPEEVNISLQQRRPAYVTQRYLR